MQNPNQSGMQRLAEDQAELEVILGLIPETYRGIRFERVLSSCHPQENTRRLELGFALTWVLAHRQRDQLGLILAAEAGDPRLSAVPLTEREWEVANLVAASVIRWLPTAVGCHFLQEAFQRGGGSMTYTLPDPKAPMPPLPVLEPPVD